MFVALGLFVAAPGEVLNQILARHNLRAFGTTMVSYTMLLVFGFFMARAIGRLFRPSRARLIHYLLFGSLGLMVEWFLLGNAPVLDILQLIAQPGMFSYWGTMLLAPLLLMEPGLTDLKKSFLRFFTLMSLTYLLLATVLPKERGGIFLAFVVFAAGTTALNFFYFRYFRILACWTKAGTHHVQ